MVVVSVSSRLLPPPIRVWPGAGVVDLVLVASEADGCGWWWCWVAPGDGGGRARRGVRHGACPGGGQRANDRPRGTAPSR